MPNDPAPSTGERPVGGQLLAAICNAVVHIQREYLGRGPNKARASIRDDTIVVLMQDTLTKAEQSLVADGRQEEVMRIRQSFQRTMRADIVQTVEQLTGRHVVAFMSDAHIDPDLACEIIVLDRPIAEDTADG